MTIDYRPRGVCSNRMVGDVENGVIRSLQVQGGCNGNLQGIARPGEGVKGGAGSGGAGGPLDPMTQGETLSVTWALAKTQSSHWVCSGDINTVTVLF